MSMSARAQFMPGSAFAAHKLATEIADALGVNLAAPRVTDDAAFYDIGNVCVSGALSERQRAGIARAAATLSESRAKALAALGYSEEE